MTLPDPDLGSDDPHQVLGVARDASPSQVRRAYRGLLRKWRPERFPLEFQQIRTAFEELKDGGKEHWEHSDSNEFASIDDDAVEPGSSISEAANRIVPDQGGSADDGENELTEFSVDTEFRNSPVVSDELEAQFLNLCRDPNATNLVEFLDTNLATLEGSDAGAVVDGIGTLVLAAENSPDAQVSDNELRQIYEHAASLSGDQAWVLDRIEQLMAHRRLLVDIASARASADYPNAFFDLLLDFEEMPEDLFIESCVAVYDEHQLFSPQQIKRAGRLQKSYPRIWRRWEELRERLLGMGEEPRKTDAGTIDASQARRLTWDAMKQTESPLERRQNAIGAVCALPILLALFLALGFTGWSFVFVILVLAAIGTVLFLVIYFMNRVLFSHALPLLRDKLGVSTYFIGDVHTVLIEHAKDFDTWDFWQDELPSCIPSWLSSASALRSDDR